MLCITRPILSFTEEFFILGWELRRKKELQILLLVPGFAVIAVCLYICMCDCSSCFPYVSFMRSKLCTFSMKSEL